MSRENVEAVRRIYDDGLIDQDPVWLLEVATPDIEYVNAPNAIEPGVRRGQDEVVQAMRRFAEPFRESGTSCTSCTTAAAPWSPPSAGTPEAGEARRS